MRPREERRAGDEGDARAGRVFGRSGRPVRPKGCREAYNLGNGCSIEDETRSGRHDVAAGDLRGGPGAGGDVGGRVGRARGRRSADAARPAGGRDPARRDAGPRDDDAPADEALRRQRAELRIVPPGRREGPRGGHVPGDGDGLSRVFSARGAGDHAGGPHPQLLHAELPRRPAAAGGRGLGGDRRLHHLALGRPARRHEPETTRGAGRDQAAGPPGPARRRRARPRRLRREVRRLPRRRRPGPQEIPTGLGRPLVQPGRRPGEPAPARGVAQGRHAARRPRPDRAGGVRRRRLRRLARPPRLPPGGPPSSRLQARRIQRRGRRPRVVRAGRGGSAVASTQGREATRSSVAGTTSKGCVATSPKLLSWAITPSELTQ